MRGLTDKVAIISGGASSIGAEIAAAFAHVGTNVVIADVEIGAGEALAVRLSDALFVRTDLASDSDIRGCVDAAIERFRRIDFVINAAALYVDQGAGSSRNDWARSFEINVTGPAMLSLAARQHLARAGGSIVNIGSISASVAQAGRWTYPASKAALAQLTRSMAIDLAGDGIRVNSVSPGWTWSTGMEKLGLTRAAVDRVAAPFHTAGRAADRCEIAGAVLFLCSDEASFVTGADLPVDSGYSAMGPEGRSSAFEKLLAEIPGEAV